VRLAELVASRAIPGAGVFAVLTRRCPLHCGHCSTDSGPKSGQHDGDMFLRFVRTFTPDCRPDYLLLTGGEPLVRPRLASALAEAARPAGTRSYILTSMYFARVRRVPAPIWHALLAVDHVAVSVDAWHEREIGRDLVFPLLHRLLSAGSDVSLQITGMNDDDPYIADLTRAVRGEFGERVPMLVGVLRRYGRAKHAAEFRPLPSADRVAGQAARPLPCLVAAWPVIGPDGTVTACGNQAVVDHAPLPGHLRLGYAATDDWETIRNRCLTRPMLRSLRVLGPLAMAAHSGALERGLGGYCDTCWRLGSDQRALIAADRLAARAGTSTVEAQVMALHRAVGAASFVRRYGSARYADLVLLGHDQPGTARCEG
jgi:pyruvate-formate lyase-activating enzyme